MITAATSLWPHEVTFPVLGVMLWMVSGKTAGAGPEGGSRQRKRVAQGWGCRRQVGEGGSLEPEDPLGTGRGPRAGGLRAVTSPWARSWGTVGGPKLPRARLEAGIMVLGALLLLASLTHSRMPSWVPVLWIQPSPGGSEGLRKVDAMARRPATLG